MEKIKMRVVGYAVYVSDCGYVLSRERSTNSYEGTVKQWVLRKDGLYVDAHQYRNDIAEEYNLELYGNN